MSFIKSIYDSSYEGDKEDYLQLFKDSGWTLVFTYPFFRWRVHVFKKPKTSDESSKIYTDNDSKSELFP